MPMAGRCVTCAHTQFDCVLSKTRSLYKLIFVVFKNSVVENRNLKTFLTLSAAVSSPRKIIPAQVINIKVHPSRLY